MGAETKNLCVPAHAFFGEPQQQGGDLGGGAGTGDAGRRGYFRELVLAELLAKNLTAPSLLRDVAERIAEDVRGNEARRTTSGGLREAWAFPKRVTDLFESG